MPQKIQLKGFDMISLISSLRKNTTKENFDEDDGLVVGVGVIIAIILLNIALWITALMMLLKHKDTMPSWAILIAIFGLIGFFIPMGPLATIIVVLVAKNSN